MSKKAIKFPLDDNNPLTFIDYNMLLLLKAENSFDLNIMLSDFLADDIVEFLERHKKLLFVLSEIWNNAIRRTIFSTEDITFPDGLLLLPPIFHRLNWIEKNPLWNDIEKKAEKRFAEDPNLVDALVTMFIDGMQASLDTALDKYCTKIKQLKHKPDEYQKAQAFRNNIGCFYGWPKEKLMQLAESA